MKKNVILQIDDNLDMLLIGERAFNTAGFSYLTARTAAEGMEKIKAMPVDLIILDYILPDLNGVQFMDMLKELPKHQSPHVIPIVLLTAHPHLLEDMRDYYPFGLRAVLHKPFGHRELVEVVENILAQEEILLERTVVVGTLPSSEEFAAALETIVRLSSDLKSSTALTEQQYLDIDAILTTGKRLLRLLATPKTVSNAVESARLEL